MQTLVIEVRGGVVQEVYTDAEELRVVLVDRDAGDDPGDAYSGGDFATARIGDMPEDTMCAVLALTA